MGDKHLNGESLVMARGPFTTSDREQKQTVAPELYKATSGKLHAKHAMPENNARAKQVVFRGDLDSRRRNKDDVQEVATVECAWLR